jgi:hypothetical protein
MCRTALQTVQTVTTLVPSFRVRMIALLGDPFLTRFSQMYQAAVFQFFLAAAVACVRPLLLACDVLPADARAGLAHRAQRPGHLCRSYGR